MNPDPDKLTGELSWRAHCKAGFIRKFGRLMIGLLSGHSIACQAIAQVNPGDTVSQDSGRAGYLVQVPLPITDKVAARVEQRIRQIAEQAPSVVSSEERPVLILEFDTGNGQTGQGSELGDCLDIAILLTDRRLRSLYSVAYVPRPSGFSENDDGPASVLQGHAVLVALACNEIAMHEDAALGQAGIDIKGDPQLEMLNYENIVGRRARFSVPVVRALVDKKLSLYQVEKLNGDVEFVDKEQLKKLESATLESSTKTLNGPGELAQFSSLELQQMRLLRNRVSSRADLTRRLDIDQQTLESNSQEISEAWQAVQLSVNQSIDSREADWTLRMLNSHLQSNPETNLIFVRLGAEDGELEPCLRIARELASFDSSEKQTVAFVEANTTGPTALIALACDHIIMTDNARLGGVGDTPISEQDLEDSRALIKRFAELVPLDWSVPMGFVDESIQVSRYRDRNGQFRLLSEEERLSLDQAKQWTDAQPVNLTEGLDFKEATRLGIADGNVNDFQQLVKDYQLSDTPITLEPSPTDKWIENIARELASPWIAAWLLFGAVFLLSTEMSHPGIGIPGFLGTLCLMLFFWSQYLDGNANWLEILLFVVGVVFVILEVFVIPGFGVFGIGGLVMIVVGIVLASQTFIIPSNSEELARLPGSLAMVLAASGGFLAGIFFIRKYLTTMPMFRRIMLNPPGSDESVSPEQREQRESMVNWSHLVGKSGTTTTPLVPAGKAQIGNDLMDVITDGRMVDRNQAIRVVEVVGNRVIVEPAES